MFFFFLKQNKPTTNQSKIELTSKVGNHDMKLPVRQWVLLVETDMEDIRSPATRCDHCSASSCFDHEGGMWMNSGWLFDISDHSNDGYLSDLYVTYCWAPSSYMFFFFSKYRCFFKYIFLCFICRVIILTASCFNHPRISHESVGLWSSWYNSQLDSRWVQCRKTAHFL